MTEAAPMDFGAELKRGWDGFIRKPVELIVGMFIAQVSMIFVVTAGPAVLGMATAALRAVRGEDVEIVVGFGDDPSDLAVNGGDSLHRKEASPELGHEILDGAAIPPDHAFARGVHDEEIRLRSPRERFPHP